MAPMNQRKEECGDAEVGPGLPRGTEFHLQGVLIALRLLGAPGHVGAALKVAQNQASDGLLVGLLEELLKQPQCGNADLGQEGVSRTPLPARLLGVPGSWLTQKSAPRMGYPLPGRFWGEWMGGGLGTGSLSGLGSLTNLMYNNRQENWLFCASVSMSKKWNTGLADLSGWLEASNRSSEYKSSVQNIKYHHEYVLTENRTVTKAVSCQSLQHCVSSQGGLSISRQSLDANENGGPQETPGVGWE